LVGEEEGEEEQEGRGGRWRRSGGVGGGAAEQSPQPDSPVCVRCQTRTWHNTASSAPHHHHHHKHPHTTERKSARCPQDAPSNFPLLHAQTTRDRKAPGDGRLAPSVRATVREPRRESRERVARTPPLEGRVTHAHAPRLPRHQRPTGAHHGRRPHLSLFFPPPHRLPESKSIILRMVAMDAMRKRYVTVSDLSSCTPWPLTLWNGRQFTPKVPVSR
jgi:hypothetical protein